MRSKQLSNSTIRTIYTVLRAALDGAVRDGLMGANPAALVKRPGVARREARSLVPAEVVRLLGAIGQSRHPTAIVVIVGTGMRRGEALALKWSDLTLGDPGRVRIRGTLSRVGGQLTVSETKTAKSRRELRLSPGVVATLRAHRKVQAAERLASPVQWPGPDYVFTTETGRAVDPRHLYRVVQVAAARAGLLRTGVHTLRHAAASAMLEAGVGIKVSDMLGHSSIAITGDIYAHVSDGAAQAASDTLAGAFGI